jgi:glyoxylate/hydroxypyruvate reductase
MALLFRSSVDSEARWKPQLTRLMPELEIRVWPEIGDPRSIDYALVWRPEPGLLASLPNLKLILSLGAGVDHILCDPQLPRHVPIVRLVDPYMTEAMSEYVVLQVLRLHRRDLDYRAQQETGIWHELEHKNAAERRVGILGFGEMGRDVGHKLKALGFDVAFWSRTERRVDGFVGYAGEAGLAGLLALSEILVCLLPLTAETEGILGARSFALLPKGAGAVDALSSID